MGKDYWQTKESVADFLNEQQERLGHPTRYEMQEMTSPRVSDTVLSRAMLGRLDPKIANQRTLAGIRSLASAVSQQERCPHCNGTGKLPARKRK